MSNWKYGTILRRTNGENVVVAVVGRMVEGDAAGRFVPSDGNSNAGLDIGDWVGVTLNQDCEPEAWGRPGDTTWLLDSKWEVVSE